MRPITFTVALFGGILVSCTAFAAGEACMLIAADASQRGAGDPGRARDTY